jgi:hypothetical protein
MLSPLYETIRYHIELIILVADETDAALQRVNGDEAVIEPAAVMAPRSTGIDIRNLQSRAHDLWAGNVVFKPIVRKLWDDVDTLLDHEVGELLCHVFGET